MNFLFRLLCASVLLGTAQAQNVGPSTDLPRAFQITVLPKPIPGTAISGVAFTQHVSTTPALRNALAGAVHVRSASGLAALPESPYLNWADPNNAEAKARRWVALSYPPANAAGREAIKRALESSGRFEQVAILPELRATQLLAEPLADYGAAVNDPQRFQWALGTPASSGPGNIGVIAAHERTLGRMNIGIIDLGLVPTHEDLSANFRKHLSWRFYNRLNSLTDFIFDDQINPTVGEVVNNQATRLEAVGHGTHVSGIIAAAKNSKGVLGTCPGCGIVMMRSPYQNDFEISVHIGITRTGVTAANFSLTAQENPAVVSTLDAQLARDTIIVGASGNFENNQGTPLPARLPGAIGVGGTDLRSLPWSELNYFASALVAPDLRHPRVNYQFAVPARCGAEGLPPECGSGYGPAIVDISAPSAQILSTITTTYIPFPVCTDFLNQNCFNTHIGSCQPAVSKFFPNFDTTGAMNQSTSPHIGQPGYGTCTGTSMAAPFVTATAGLIRSINPLLPKHSVLEAITSTGKPIPDPASPGTFFPSSRVGAGLLDVNAALIRALGTVKNQVAKNRLTPMFSLFRNNQSPVIPNPAPPPAPPLIPLPVSERQAWLYTSNVQTASVSLLGDLYQFSLEPISLPFGPGSPLGIGLMDTQALTTFPGGAIKSSTPASFSFYVFSTEHLPTSLAGNALVPLYRLSWKCMLRPKFTYATTEGEVNSPAIGSRNWFTSRSGTGCPNSVPNFWDHAYNYDGIEGYIYSPTSPQPAGTFALRRFYNNDPLVKSWALIMDGEQSQSAYAGYTSKSCGSGDCPELLGYVYPNVSYSGGTATLLPDTDSDGLRDNIEQVIGTNFQTNNSDCDSLSDGMEYPLAGLSPSDPMAGTGICHDLQVSAQRNPGSLQLKLSNFGPTPASNAQFKIALYSASSFSVNIPMPAGCASITPAPHTGQRSEWLCTFSSLAATGSVDIFMNQISAYSSTIFLTGEAIESPFDQVLSNNIAGESCPVGECSNGDPF